MFEVRNKDFNLINLSEIIEYPSLVYFDPPFNIGVEYGGNKLDDMLFDEEYYDKIHRILELKIKLLYPRYIAIFFPPTQIHLQLICHFLHCGTYQLQEMITWHRTFGNQSNNPSRLSSTSTIIYVLKKKDSEGKPKWDRYKIPSARLLKYDDIRGESFGKIPGRVWDIPDNPNSDVWKVSMVNGTFNERVHWHPAQHPTELAKRIILPLTEENELIVDPMCGTATSGVVALQHNRNYIGYEIIAGYAKLAKERLAKEYDKTIENSKPSN